MWTAIANELGGSITSLDRDIWEIARGERSIRVRLHELPFDNDVVLKLCGRKPLVHRLLSDANLPVPSYKVFTLNSLHVAYQFLEKHPLGVVVKPCDGYSGFGVTTHITTTPQLKRAAALASLYLDNLMVETQVAGENYRLLVYKGRMLHAVKRTGQNVVGDGQSTIAELMNRKNSCSISPEDTDVAFTLKSQGLSSDLVPVRNEKILISSIASAFSGGKELRTVYDTTITDKVHPAVRAAAEQCAAVVRSDLVGVDIITTDIDKPLKESGGVINEVNTTPALHHHYDEENETYPFVALHIVRDLLT